MEGLSCMNCKAEVPPDTVKFFAEVFLCTACFEVAERFYKRSENELKMMLTLLKDRMREDLIQGRFFVGEKKDFEAASKADVFKAIVQLEEQRAASRAEAPQLPPPKKSKT